MFGKVLGAGFLVEEVVVLNDLLDVTNLLILLDFGYFAILEVLDVLGRLRRLDKLLAALVELLSDFGADLDLSLVERIFAQFEVKHVHVVVGLVERGVGWVKVRVGSLVRVVLLVSQFGHEAVHHNLWHVLVLVLEVLEELRMSVALGPEAHDVLALLVVHADGHWHSEVCCYLVLEW